MNAAEVAEQTSFYQTLSMVLLIMAIVFLVLSIVLWFVFKIPHSIKVLTRFGFKKEVKRITTDGQVRSGKAVLTWNTSGLLNREPSTDLEATTVLDEATTVLDDATTLLDEETVVLQEPVEQDYEPEGFEIEEDIKMLGTNKSL